MRTKQIAIASALGASLLLPATAEATPKASLDANAGHVTLVQDRTYTEPYDDDPVDDVVEDVGGVVGGVVTGIAGGVVGAPVAGDPYQLCAARFRSFNPDTGTYTTYQGETRVCPYLQQ